jgi:outer membrane receptor protein involved in Fe transport
MSRLKQNKQNCYMKTGNIRRSSLLLLSFLLFFIFGNTQQFNVRGKLVDSVSAKPVADASVNFLQFQTKVSTTVMSDKNGVFQTSLLPGPYKVTITHNTFKDKTTHLALQGPDADMGSIQLVATVKSLAEVKVTAVKPFIEQQADKLIYNVEADPSAKSESATDLLRKTPYVSVDGDGGIQVNGQSNFKVLLNGRETAMFSQNVKEALKGFPGANISRIEVITSPSAKYDAEGIGGIINIITKKKIAGYNGTINSNINSTGSENAGLNFNLKSGKIGVSAVYSVLSNQNYRTQILGITKPAQSFPFVRREVGGPRETDIFFNQANLELSYDLDSMHTLVVYGNMSKLSNEAVNEHSTYTLFANGNSETSPFLLETTMKVPGHGFGTDLIKKYKGKPQKELSFRFNALYNTNRSFNNSQQGIDATERFLLSNSEAFNREYTAQVDFVNPVNKTTRIETGVKTIFRNAYSDFESQVKFNKADPYQMDPSNTNKFAYDQNVYGAYMTINKTMKFLTARIGLRVEHTRVDGNFISSHTSVKQVYTNFIPNVLFTKQINKSMNANLSYTFRLGRPSISSLNPFVNNTDSLYKTFGNPDLGPQYIHNITFQYRIFKGNRFISFQTGFNFSNNLIIQSPTFDAVTGVTSITSANAGQLREFNLGFVSNLPLGKKWNIAVNATGRYAHARNSLQGSWLNSTAGNVNGNITFRPTKFFTISSNAGYFMPLRTPNTSFPDNYFYVFNFAYKLFKEKLTITASTTNFLEKERTLTSLTENQSFVTENISTIPFRNFGLSLSYSFGKLKENVSKKKGVNNDDQVQ